MLVRAPARSSIRCGGKVAAVRLTRSIMCETGRKPGLVFFWAEIHRANPVRVALYRKRERSLTFSAARPRGSGRTREKEQAQQVEVGLGRAAEKQDVGVRAFSFHELRNDGKSAPPHRASPPRGRGRTHRSPARGRNAPGRV